MIWFLACSGLFVLTFAKFYSFLVAHIVSDSKIGTLSHFCRLLRELSIIQCVIVVRIEKNELLNYPKLWDIQSTLVISKSKRPSETLRDIRTSTYQMCGIEEHTNRKTKFHK